ncbi:MAG: hypothetical protein HQL52_11415 [Magnetococcales bacterium]|nr:hypothetical protein [Magnetococcales bacterium]
MNKSILSTAAIIALVVATPVWAETPDFEESQQEDQAICERYAQEDQVAPDEVAEYMSQCLRDLSGSADGDYGPSGSEEEITVLNVKEPHG